MLIFLFLLKKQLADLQVQAKWADWQINILCLHYFVLK